MCIVGVLYTYTCFQNKGLPLKSPLREHYLKGSNVLSLYGNFSFDTKFIKLDHCGSFQKKSLQIFLNHGEELIDRRLNLCLSTAFQNLQSQNIFQPKGRNKVKKKN